MIGIVFSIDYEVYGDGYGDIGNLIIKPTEKFLDILENYNGKGTIFAEAAEFIAMKKYNKYKNDLEFIEKQLKRAHENGHDIELHVHSWWKDAKYDKDKWLLDYNNSALGILPVEEVYIFIKECKDYLEKILGNCSRTYQCRAFRAGSWAVEPSKNLFDALSKLDILIDSSVYKWGKMDTRYAKFDYSNAPSNIRPWFFDKSDITKIDDISKNLNEGCLEVPIYAEMKRTLKFVTMKRIRMRNRVRSAIIESDTKRKRNILENLKTYSKIVFGKRAKKLDFCKCNYREMKRMIEKINREHHNNDYMPVVAIGHSKDFIYHEDFLDFMKLLKYDYHEKIEIITLSKAVDKYLENMSYKTDSN